MLACLDSLEELGKWLCDVVVLAGRSFLGRNETSEAALGCSGNGYIGRIQAQWPLDIRRLIWLAPTSNIGLASLP